jgi:hypothetical protein
MRGTLFRLIVCLFFSARATLTFAQLLFRYTLGYHSQKWKHPGYKNGTLDSYYYAPQSMAPIRKIMRTYKAVEPPFWRQEHPVAWRDIDHGVEPQDMVCR